jgi:phosphoribosylamine--glycine ligase
VRVLVVGSGGREHALVRTLLRSPQSPEVLCAPGNAGIRRDARALDAPVDDPAALARAARDARVDLVVVGPEAPLVAGVADALAAEGVRCFGPPAAAARLEGSKAFAKEIMEAAGVPTAAHRVVTTLEEGLAAVTGYPAVIKADGLAAGKGVVIAADQDEARAALEDMLVVRRFGEQPVVVEEFLAGDELSLLALCDGERAVPLAPARDYKRIGDGDTGPNTGGMGCYSPVPGADALVRDAIASVHQPVVDELARRGTPFHGVLYAGLMLGRDGHKVLEFNVRFGDPETQVVLPRLESDLLALLWAAARGELAGFKLAVKPAYALCVVVAAKGYPGKFQKGDLIELPAPGSLPPAVTVYHAGTAKDAGGQLTANGGRVLGVTALAPTLREAATHAYAACNQIRWANKYYRRDIGAKQLNRR